MLTIKKLQAIMILDSRGIPTVEAQITLSDGTSAKASAPSGSSVGEAEAIELRDNVTSMWGGKGVSKALYNINTIIYDKIRNMPIVTYDEMDNILINIDGTPQKSFIGANAILPVSLAYAKVLAKLENKHLYQFLDLGYNQGKIRPPTPMFNIINGGVHADNKLDIQEFMIVPIGIDAFIEKMRAGSEIFHTLRKRLIKDNMVISVGDEGGFAPRISRASEALDMIVDAIDDAGYNGLVTIALDLAASQLYCDGYYTVENKKFNNLQMSDYIKDLCNQYPISSIEDPMHEFDYEGWVHITNALGRRLQIVGDDVFVTNVNMLNIGLERGFANAVLIKPNQVGTLSETIETVKKAHESGYKTVISHRSGETEDATIAHLGLAFGCHQIKAGSLSRSERLCKYNELIRILSYS